MCGGEVSQWVLADVPTVLVKWPNECVLTHENGARAMDRDKSRGECMT